MLANSYQAKEKLILFHIPKFIVCADGFNMFFLALLSLVIQSCNH